MSLIQTIYKPAMMSGQVYARPYGSSGARIPVGNCLELVLSHEEDVKRQPDMTAPGGGTYAKVSRISQVNVAIKLADWNPVNFARSTFGTAGTVAGATVADAAHNDAALGGIIRLPPKPTTVTVKKVASPAPAPVAASGNYEVRPGGVFLLPEAADIAEGDDLLITYTHPEYVNVEALTTAAPELELFFEGLNEADSGKPYLIDLWRVSSGIVQQLGLIQSEFGTLDVNGELVSDPTKVGVGVSKYYRAQMT